LRPGYYNKKDANYVILNLRASVNAILVHTAKLHHVGIVELRTFGVVMDSSLEMQHTLQSVIRLESILSSHSTWSRDQLLDYQQEALALLLRRILTSSTFYSTEYGKSQSGSLTSPSLTKFPIIRKSDLMDAFDKVIENRVVDRSTAERMLRNNSHPVLVQNYLVLASSGTSGRRGLYVFSPDEQRYFLAASLRRLRYAGIYSGPDKAPASERIAWLYSDSFVHATHWTGTVLSMIDGYHVNKFARTSFNDLVWQVQDFNPEVLIGFPSRILQLARAQIDGRISIHPNVVAASGEVLSSGARILIGRAFSVEPFNLYGMTEGVFGAECDRHNGVHLFEDVCLLESVDELGRYVPDEQTSSGVLVTSLTRHVQPVIRMTVDDRLIISSTFCDCGSPFRLIKNIEGRMSDLLTLYSTQGEIHQIPMLDFAGVLDSDEAVESYSIGTREGCPYIAVQLTPTGAHRGVRERIVARIYEH
jgi:phenylacetate-CoA ligase